MVDIRYVIFVYVVMMIRRGVSTERFKTYLISVAAVLQKL